MNTLVFHSFTLEKAGRGFKTVAYRSSFGKSHDLFSEDPLIKMPISDRHSTLAKVKKDFLDTDIFTCVVEGHLMAPSALIQLVVERS